MKNLRCKVHQLQPITNFCLKQQCLSQLCASCISHHTNMHILIGTIPQYQNIQQTLMRTTQTIDASRVALQLQKKNIMSFNRNWQKKKQLIYQRFVIAKKQMIDMINKVFIQIQKNIQQKFHQEQLLLGLQHHGQIIKMMEQCNGELEKLENLQKKLQTIKCTDTVKILYAEVFPEINALVQKINHNIGEFQGHDVEFSYPIGVFKDIRLKLIDLMSVKSVYTGQKRQPLHEVPHPQQQPQQPQPETLTSSQTFNPLIKTSSSFYTRPKSLPKQSTIPSTVFYLNGGSQIKIQAKPKITTFPRNINMNQTLNKSQFIFGNLPTQNPSMTTRSFSSQIR